MSTIRGPTTKPEYGTLSQVIAGAVPSMAEIRFARFLEVVKPLKN
jgi:hypothetical protein